MQAGTMVLNGLTDKQFAAVLEFKSAHEGSFNLNLTQIQQGPAPGPVGIGAPAVVYNNVIIGWPNDAGLKTLLPLLATLVP